MANTKISALTSSTTPLAGTEVLPIVQSSATVKVAVSDLTAGRSVSMSAGTISSGNLTFSSTAQRIVADFSGSLANRLAFQTSTVNGQTIITVIPNGTSTASVLNLEGDSALANGPVLALINNAGGSGSESRLSVGIRGAGTYLPFTFYLSGSEKARFDINGNFGVGASSPSTYGRLAVVGSGTTSSTNTAVFLDSSAAYNFVIRNDGLVSATKPIGLGYGTGAGGTVTQATSRTTGVTLSKPTGAITMFSALGSAVAATFTVTNTLVAATDTIILNQQSGTNLYVLLVTAVAAGSFNITFYTTGGVATDAPVINFAIIKGVTA